MRKETCHQGDGYQVSYRAQEVEVSAQLATIIYFTRPQGAIAGQALSMTNGTLLTDVAISLHHLCQWNLE